MAGMDKMGDALNIRGKREGDQHKHIGEHKLEEQKFGVSKEPGFVDKIKDKIPGGENKGEHKHEEPKEGLVEQIKNKIPGGEHKEEHKEGFVEQIKHKIPGGENKEEHKEAGLMDKIKHKVPGGDHGSDKKEGM